ncbi:uncharacterized protein BO97DRAFT_136748 [Aspergillus homomorphus CBS 101889]|uniref:Uncharacterized protein n=1 Tax=Aspergillus homomorphus (strain CBS 101889) TaxID=1450537 RepID=A0A395I936_ASPHC|nr:hypothetical protein BO97DRAFT_136748 [Aspergillus homomorphus CBS 101889]RAL16526.1 hypothetical protein BO97DRAFT_136748 [Aspergillus homomorphus CBS 101889]
MGWNSMKKVLLSHSVQLCIGRLSFLPFLFFLSLSTRSIPLILVACGYIVLSFLALHLTYSSSDWSDSMFRKRSSLGDKVILILLRCLVGWGVAIAMFICASSHL